MGMTRGVQMNAPFFMLLFHIGYYFSRYNKSEINLFEADPMRTTLNLPENLVKTAMRITGAKTKTGLVTLALEQIIKKNRLQRLKRFRGKVYLNVDLDCLRNRKKGNLLRLETIGRGK
jgi:hypothetical protein